MDDLAEHVISNFLKAVALFSFVRLVMWQ